MLRNLVTSILLYESIRTTKKRAEVVQPLVEKMITAAKTKDARNAIRSINQFVMDQNACKKVMEVLKDRYSKRTSGFTRIVPLGARHGDGAKMVTLELVDAAVTGGSSDSSGERAERAKTAQTAKKNDTRKKTSSQPS